MKSLFETYIHDLKVYDTYSLELSHTSYFSYDNSDCESYQKLKKKFLTENTLKGKSIFEKTIHLMDFVHHELFFAGDPVYPNKSNALEIMNVRKTGSLFCCYQAIVLSEMLTSVGIISRVISCLPHNFDHDSHMAVMVFDTDTLRWFFVDPTFNTYFHSEQGDPLDIFQVRSLYQMEKCPSFKPINIAKQWPLVCNGVIFDTYDEWYRLYMAKNTFRFMSPATSYFDCLSDNNLHWIAINPLNYTAQNEYDEGKKITYIHSVHDFLQAP